jgi:ABC-type glycerol-3-phosphate transport system substrate-binding protein
MLFIRRLYGVLLIFLILCLTGCSAGQDANLPANDSSVTELKTETTKAGEKAEPVSNFDTRFTVLCDRILTDRQKESVDTIIDELNILSRNALGITVKFVFTDPNKRYSDFLKLLIDSGDAPDIFHCNLIRNNG